MPTALCQIIIEKSRLKQQIKTIAWRWLDGGTAGFVCLFVFPFEAFLSYFSYI